MAKLEVGALEEVATAPEKVAGSQAMAALGVVVAAVLAEAVGVAELAVRRAGEVGARESPLACRAGSRAAEETAAAAVQAEALRGGFQEVAMDPVAREATQVLVLVVGSELD